MNRILSLFLIALAPLAAHASVPSFGSFDTNDFVVTPSMVAPEKIHTTTNHTGTNVFNVSIVTNLFVTNLTVVNINGSTNNAVNYWTNQLGFLTPIDSTTPVSIKDFRVYGSDVRVSKAQGLAIGTNVLETGTYSQFLLGATTANPSDTILQLKAGKDTVMHLELMNYTNGNPVTSFTLPNNSPLADLPGGYVRLGGDWVSTNGSILLLRFESPDWVEAGRLNIFNPPVTVSDLNWTNELGVLRPTPAAITNALTISDTQILGYGGTFNFNPAGYIVVQGPTYGEVQINAPTTGNYIDLYSDDTWQYFHIQAEESGGRYLTRMDPRAPTTDFQNSPYWFDTVWTVGTGTNILTVANNSTNVFTVTPSELNYYNGSKAVSLGFGPNAFVGTSTESVMEILNKDYAIWLFGNSLQPVVDDAVNLGTGASSAWWHDIGLKGKLYFGPGDTNFIHRSNNENLAIALNGTNRFEFQNWTNSVARRGMAIYGTNGTTDSVIYGYKGAGDATITPSSGFAFVDGLLIAQGIAPTSDNNYDLGSSASNGAWRNLYLKSSAYIEGYNNGSGNYSRLNISHTGATNGVIEFTSEATVGGARPFRFNGADVILANSHTPANSSETNFVGAITWDSTNLYIWTATNVNKKVTLTSW